ncbi:Protein moonraker [Triplophysa tibetana]|uniref:Protein moonraker n=1 Tax=Triplophysa tibetana TaxID=1572043 RepID=A0A5A9MXB4_9TELE|nr:Protein moonraker [Triplophysa tibetana]
MTIGERGYVNREWILKRPSVFQIYGLQSQLQFNDTVAPSVLNRATRVGPPSPIVIEKLVHRAEGRDDAESCTSSLRLSVLSEDRLQAAVMLAKKDLRRKRQESISHLSVEHLLERSQNTSPQKNNTDHSFQVSSGGTPKTSGQKNHTKPSAQVIVCTPPKPSGQPRPGRTPPTKDLSNEQQLSQEIRKLQKELSTYVQRIEQLANKGRVVEVLEPDVKRRMEIRRQEQAARSARIIYVLQKQVKEIQEDLDKLHSQNTKQTKKFVTVDRLAAAHRGAIRAVQVFINQLSDPAESKVPTYCKELGQLIRQLSLCSAKVEVRQGSSVCQTALDILQKLETLDSALSKQEKPMERDPALQNINPAEKTSAKVVSRSTSPHHPVKGPIKRTSRRGPPRKPTTVKTAGSRMAGKPHRTSQSLVKERNEVLKAGLESLMHNKQKRDTEPQKTKKTISAINPAHVKAGHIQDCNFQQPTVSSRLRENQVPERETTVPWIPTSPHSPSRQRLAHIVVASRPEPRCLFSSVKNPEKQQPQVKSVDNTQLSPSSHDRKQVQNEAVRQAWLERMTAERLRELNLLSEEEADRINKLRTTVGSPTQWAEKAERVARERIQPLLDQAQQVAGGESDALRQQLKAAVNPEASAEVLSEAVLDDLLEDAARALWTTERQQVAETEAERRLQGPTLESMLLRMEEMERDQEEVRRRFGMISYSDPHTWDKGTDGSSVKLPFVAETHRYMSSSRPASPQPIRLTKPVFNAPTTADIFLQEPVETGAVSETSVLDEDSSVFNDPSHAVKPGVKSSGGLYLSVPPSMQRSIQKYRENHDAFLQLLSHEAMGNFNPWAIADSLAEELMDEALADVAAEFQDVSSLRKLSASHWRMQNIAQESVDSSDDEFFDAREVLEGKTAMLLGMSQWNSNDLVEQIETLGHIDQTQALQTDPVLACLPWLMRLGPVRMWRRNGEDPGGQVLDLN